MYCWYMPQGTFQKCRKVFQTSIENMKNMMGYFIMHGGLVIKAKIFWIQIHTMLQKILKINIVKNFFYWDYG